MPSLYEITVPVFLHAFGNLSKNLDKAKSFADEKGIAHEELLGARLYADMHPLTAQVQRASDTAKFVVSRIGGIAGPSMADEEKSFDDLRSRIAATKTFLKLVPADAFNGKEGNEIVLKFGPRSVPFKTAVDYALVFALPNFYFHVTTAYAILRHKGVPLGKMDFIGGGA